MSRSLNHSLNNSTSKMKYSFCKANRFLPTIKSQCEVYHDVPDGKSHRSTSFGFGKKISVSVDSFSPPPGTYSPLGIFDKTAKAKGFSFGFGRQETVGGPLAHMRYTKEIPGPGTYATIDTLDNSSITLKPKLPDFSTKRKSFIPGPGAYNPPSTINSDGRYVISSHTNSKAAKFSLAKSLNYSLQLSKVPGPGTYTTKQGINKEGRYVDSRHFSSFTRTFGKSPRSSPTLKHLIATPGPGTYISYSQFETPK